jgi:hypothetical protein
MLVLTVFDRTLKTPKAEPPAAMAKVGQHRLRKAMRRIAHRHDDEMPGTIEDPGVLHALRPVLKRVADEGEPQAIAAINGTAQH